MNGLAWTEAGGEVLSLEANLSRGRGLLLTGQLGDVMKESGQTALSYVRSILAEIGVDEREFGKQQVHVHVPAGAAPAARQEVRAWQAQDRPGGRLDAGRRRRTTTTSTTT